MCRENKALIPASSGQQGEGGAAAWCGLDILGHILEVWTQRRVLLLLGGMDIKAGWQVLRLVTGWC
jgi:hypothetical protein